MVNTILRNENHQLVKVQKIRHWAVRGGRSSSQVLLTLSCYLKVLEYNQSSSSLHSLALLLSHSLSIISKVHPHWLKHGISLYLIFNSTIHELQIYLETFPKGKVESLCLASNGFIVTSRIKMFTGVKECIA